MLSKLLSGEQTERGDRNRGGKAQVAWTPHFNKRETRFAIVLILRDSDGVAEGAGFSGFGCTERVVFGGDDGDNFRCVGDEICREEAWAVPETRFGLGMWLSRFEQLMRT
jgi:hypothetical protein